MIADDEDFVRIEPKKCTETNFFSDIIMRNTDVTSITTDAFAVPTYTVNMASPAPSFIKVLGDGPWMYTGAGHGLWNGTTGPDKILSDTGDDSIYGDAGIYGLVM